MSRLSPQNRCRRWSKRPVKIALCFFCVHNEVTRPDPNKAEIRKCLQGFVNLCFKHCRKFNVRPEAIGGLATDYPEVYYTLVKEGKVKVRSVGT